MLKHLAIPLVILFLLSACQTSMTRQFSEVKSGMEKDDVLGLMGSPNRTERFHGKDRWTYVFYENRIRFEKEIQFFEGNAVYVGDPWSPEEAKSAVEVDRQNEFKNKITDDKIAKEKVEQQKAYGEYEKEVKGETKVIYTPQFLPIR